MKRFSRGVIGALSMTGLLGCTIVVPGPLVVPRPSTAPGPGVVAPPQGPAPVSSGRPVAPATGRPELPWIGDPTPPPLRQPEPSYPDLGAPGLAPPPDDAQVALDYVSSLAIASDGSLYIMGEYDHLIWKRSPDGALTRVAGNPDAAGEPGDLDGQVAADVELGTPEAVAVDGQDRLLILANARVLRLEPDGRLKDLGGGWGMQGGYLLPVEGDEVLLMSTYTWDTTAQLVSFAPGREPRQIAELDLGADTHMRGCGIDAQGRIVAGLDKGGLITVDRATGAFQPLAGAPEGATVDARGVIYSRLPDGQLAVTIDGKTTPVGRSAVGSETLAYDPERRVAYLSTLFQVAAIDQGHPRWVAGLPVEGAIARPAAGFRATRPGGLAVRPDGRVAFGDIRVDRVFELDADGSTVRGPAMYADVRAGGVLRADDQGRLWSLGAYGDGVRCLDGGGNGPAGMPSELVDFLPLPGDAMLVSARPMTDNGRQMQVLHVGPKGVTKLIDEPENPGGGYGSCFALAQAPGGAAWIVGRDRVVRWTPNGLDAPIAVPGLQLSFGSEDAAYAAVAPDGRLYVAAGGLQRLDPTAGTLAPVTLPAPPRGIAGLGFARDGALVYLDATRRRLVTVPAGQF